jgi:hypothetical protein
VSAAAGNLGPISLGCQHHVCVPDAPTVSGRVKKQNGAKIHLRAGGFDF